MSQVTSQFSDSTPKAGHRPAIAVEDGDVEQHNVDACPKRWRWLDI
jgi:hypothetical protein